MGSALTALVKTVAKIAVNVGKLAVELVKGNPSITLSIPSRYHFGGKDSSPWGLAKLLHVWIKPESEQDPNDALVKAEKAKEGPELLPDNLSDKTHVSGSRCN